MERRRKHVHGKDRSNRVCDVSNVELPGIQNGWGVAYVFTPEYIAVSIAKVIMCPGAEKASGIFISKRRRPYNLPGKKKQPERSRVYERPGEL